MHRSSKGFTIVELVIVIVLIAILSVILALGYAQLIQTTQAVSVRHDMRSISKQIEVYAIDYERYPSIAEFQNMGIRVNKQTYGVNPVGATIFYCVDNAGTAFSIVARVKSSLILKYLSTEGGVSDYSGSGTAPQLCVDSGVPGPTSNVNYTGFTNNGSWNSWVKG